MRKLLLGALSGMVVFSAAILPGKLHAESAVVKATLDCPIDQYEPNDAFAQAYGPLAWTEPYAAAMCPLGDYDFFYFEVESYGMLEVVLDNAPTWTYWTLLLFDSTPWWLTSTAVNGTSARITTNVGVGRYYLVVDAASSVAGTGPYRLRVFFSPRPTPTSTQTVFSTSTPTVSPVATETTIATVTGCPTSTRLPTATPPGDLTMTGRVFDVAVGPEAAIVGASVSVVLCIPSRLGGLTATDGSYSILLPAQLLSQCSAVILEAAATGYKTYVLPVSVLDLYADSDRDFALLRLPTPTPSVTATLTLGVFTIHLPIIVRV